MLCRRAALELAEDLPGESLAEFHAPLIETVDAPEHPFDEGFVLIERQERAEALRIKAIQ